MNATTNNASHHVAKVICAETEICLSNPSVPAYETSECVVGTCVKVNLGLEHPLVLTNAHVVEACGRRVCVLSQAHRGLKHAHARITHLSPELDIAVLQCTGDHMEPCNVQSRACIGQAVKAIGFALDAGSAFTSHGTLEGTEGHYLKSNQSINGGCSGGPLFQDNCVIGINTASSGEAIAFAVPMYTIAHYLRTEEARKLLGRVPKLDVSLSPRAVNGGGHIVTRVGAPHHGLLRVNDIVTHVNGQPLNAQGRFSGGHGGAYGMDLSSLEFALSAPPEVTLTVRRRDNKRPCSVVIPRVVRRMAPVYPLWEHVRAVHFAGMVLLEINDSVLEAHDQDVDEEEDAPLHSEIDGKHRVVITWVLPQGLAASAGIGVLDRVMAIGDVPVFCMDDADRGVAQAHERRRTRHRTITVEVNRVRYTFAASDLAHEEAEHRSRLPLHLVPGSHL